EFLDKLVGTDQIPSVQKAFRERDLQKKVFYKYPVASAILCYLNLEEYRSLKKHTKGIIAKKFSLSEEDEDQILKALETLQIIELRDRKYNVLTEHFDLKAPPEEMRSARRYWLNLAQEFNESGPTPVENTGFGVDVHAASHSAVKQIREEALSFFLKA